MVAAPRTGNKGSHEPLLGGVEVAPGENDLLILAAVLALDLAEAREDGQEA
jgi:hypothetical protein